MHGLHLTADLYQCRCETRWLVDARALGPWCVATVEAAGLQALDQLVHTRAAGAGGAGGVTATVLLAGSHVCLHTWPQQRIVTADVYVSQVDADPSAQARGLMDALIARFQPEWTEQRSLDRGDGV